jgi:hypothetical protein
MSTDTLPRVDQGQELVNYGREVRRRWPTATDADLTASLALWTQTMGGMRFVGTAGQVGVVLLHKLTAQHGSMPSLQPVDLGAMSDVFSPRAATRTWSHLAPLALDVDAPMVLGLDVHGQYLATLGGLELGTGQPERMGPTRFAGADDPVLGLPGYALLGTVTPTRDWIPTTVTGTWVALPMVKLLARVGAISAATALWVWPQHRRWLSAWGGVVGRALDTLGAAAGCPTCPRTRCCPRCAPPRYALSATKEVYAAFLGGMIRSARYNRTAALRPDWCDQIVATADANMRRALDRTFRAPLAVVKDTAYFSASYQDLTAVTERGGAWNGLTISGQRGKWHLTRRCPANDIIIAALATGSPVRVRDAVTAAHLATGGAR